MGWIEDVFPGERGWRDQPGNSDRKRHAPEADELREEVVRQFGKRGLIALSFAMLTARMYPTLKYALGHGSACTRLAIGGETVPVLRDVTQSMPRASAA